MVAAAATDARTRQLTPPANPRTLPPPRSDRAAAKVAMRLLRIALIVALFASAGLGIPGCKKAEPAAAPAAAATVAPAAAPAPATATATAAAPTPAAAPAEPKLSVLDTACPGEGEDAAACPKKPDKVDDDIQVGHVLIGWAGSLPGETVTRTKPEALKLAKEVAHEARKAGTDFVKLIWQSSQDPGPGVYKVTPDLRGRYVPQFTAMALSLGVGQVDVVETDFGYHVMKRVPFDFVAPEKPLEKVMTDACPAPGEDPAACPTPADKPHEKVKVSHVLIAYAGAMRSAEMKLTKDQAKVEAIRVAHEARKKGADFAKLVKEFSKDPGEGTYEVMADSQFVPGFKQLALSLGKGQVDIVETPFGFHVMKRVD